MVVANATVDVNVGFSAYDVKSGQQYKMVGKIVGDDTPEGNADDPIPNGSLTPVITLPGGPPIELGQLVQADGLTSKTFTFTKTVAKADLDEDGAQPGRDPGRGDADADPAADGHAPEHFADARGLAACRRACGSEGPQAASAHTATAASDRGGDFSCLHAELAQSLRSRSVHSTVSMNADCGERALRRGTRRR